MLLQKETYEACGCCGTRKRVADQIYGCDVCRRVLDFNKPDVDYHKFTLFLEDPAPTQDFIMCSIPCVVKWLRAFKPPKNYRFIDFPLITSAGDMRHLQRLLFGKRRS